MTLRGAKRGDKKEIEARLSALNSQQEERLAQHRADTFRLPYIDLFAFPVDGNVLQLLSRERAEEAGAVLFYKKGKDVRLGAVNPASPGVIALLKEISEELNARVALYVISEHSFRVTLARYPKVVQRDEMTEGEMKLLAGRLTSYEEAIASLNELGKKIASVPPTQILSAIVSGAVAMRASDIHLEPRKTSVRLRYRIDGVLQDVAEFELEGWQQVLSRVKVLGDMKINVHSVPQDGSFVLRIDGERHDVRLSVLPGNHGEYVVMRLLSQAAEALTLEDLGMKDRDRKVVAGELRQSTGMVLAAGPTGSGKTTTIAAALQEVNRPELKIITLEDPVEYRVPGIEQTEVDAEAGYTFAVGLRSILRQDPDVVFVGEIRDNDTAETSVHAAMTGHLVFSTIHANDAPGVVLRLEGMGIKPYVVAPALNLVISQRLVRVICKECGEEYEVDQKMREHIAGVMEGVAPSVFDRSVLRDPKLRFMRAKGCEACGMTGYRGRIGVYEVFAVKGEVEELILSGADAAKIRDAAQKTGMTTLAQDGYLKVIEKMTTVEEVQRVSEE